ncbi:MAG: riboflavin synthase [Planctomycetes bacterium]|nr:riboflavin synthase [Planctomycetota bacterium]MCB9917275.1 riboflavin synthase [Planctomycetota bacterium]
MFTGLIEAIGRVAFVRRSGGGLDLVVELPVSFDDVAIGDSIALSGCCTTVTKIARHGAGYRAEFHMVPETLAKTTFGTLEQGRRVNLERALRADARLGGHFVQGHVDGLGKVSAIAKRHDGMDLGIDVPCDLARYCVAKGSITIDGISLTIAKLEDATSGPSTVTIALIPHTLEHTTLGDRSVGDAVHLEVDVLAKYVERFAAPHLG